mmetsp:Transcript_9517/g.14287  ORF Transcript_9517/g.14287 Transcript_9517/m.14287 type:complete len:193 (-) Transcript_9517:111-689(-)
MQGRLGRAAQRAGVCFLLLGSVYVQFKRRSCSLESTFGGYQDYAKTARQHEQYQREKKRNEIVNPHFDLTGLMINHVRRKREIHEQTVRNKTLQLISTPPSRLNSKDEERIALPTDDKLNREEFFQREGSNLKESHTIDRKSRRRGKKSSGRRIRRRRHYVESEHHSRHQKQQRRETLDHYRKNSKSRKGDF